MRRIAIVLGLVACVACHNGNWGTEATTSLTAPLPMGPARLTLVSGESQAPVASARVTIDGQTYVTDAAGQVALERNATLLDIQAPGFLERRALLGNDRFSLWPQRSPTGLDEAYTARLVYNCGAPGCVDGGEPLGRVPQGAVAVRAAAALRADPGALAALQEAVQLWNDTTRGEIAFVLTTAAPGGVVVDVDLDPADPVILALGAAAVTRREHAGAAISRARISVRSVALARRVPLLLHELGHAFGLAHSPRLGDVMWNGPELYDSTDLSPREKLAVTLMLQRSSGNRFPDNDAAILATATRALRSTVFSCGER